MKTSLVVLITVLSAGMLSACGESAQEKLARQQLEEQEKDRQRTTDIVKRREAATDAVLHNKQ